MRNVLLASALALLGLAGAAPTSAQPVHLQWELATWPGASFDGNPATPDALQNQAESGEDWAYSVVNSYNGLGQQDGYVFGGYSTFRTGGYTAPGCPPAGIQAQPTLAKVDLNGNVLWHRALDLAGWFYRIIRTSDGGYLGVGLIRDRNRVYYNPTPTDSTASGALSCATSGPRRRLLFAARFNATGQVLWRYAYGEMDNPNNHLTTQPFDDAGWDAVEMPGGFRIVGTAFDPVNGNAPRAFVVDVNTNGRVLGHRTYGPPRGAQSNRTIATAIARRNNDYVVVGTQFNGPPGSNERGDVFVMRLDGTTAPAPSAYNALTSTSTVHDYGFDVAYSTGGDVFVSAVVDCNLTAIGGGCFQGGASGEGTARVYRVNNQSLAPISSTGSLLGTVRAFDLWVRLAPTSDGGMAVLSTMQDPIRQDLQFTNAYVIKLDASGAVSWRFTYDARTNLARDGEGIVGQECVYEIVQAADGGYVIAGNNSSNLDDDYIVRFAPATSQTVSSGTIRNSDIVYAAADQLTVGPTVALDPAAGEQTARATFLGGNRVLWAVPFTAPLYSEVRARIETAPLNFLPVFGLGARGDGEGETSAATPAAFAVYPPRPNPTAGEVDIAFELPEDADVTLTLHDALGREVARQTQGTQPAGAHTVRFDGSALPAGVYVYRLAAGDRIFTGRLTVLR